MDDRAYLLRLTALLGGMSILTPLALQIGSLAQLYIGGGLPAILPLLAYAAVAGLITQRLLAAASARRRIIAGVTGSCVLAVFTGVQAIITMSLRQIAAASPSTGPAAIIGSGPTVPVPVLAAGLFICFNAPIIRRTDPDQLDPRWLGLYALPIGLYLAMPMAIRTLF